MNIPVCTWKQLSNIYFDHCYLHYIIVVGSFELYKMTQLHFWGGYPHLKTSIFSSLRLHPGIQRFEEQVKIHHPMLSLDEKHLGYLAHYIHNNAANSQVHVLLCGNETLKRSDGLLPKPEDITTYLNSLGVVMDVNADTKGSFLILAGNFPDNQGLSPILALLNIPYNFFFIH